MFSVSGCLDQVQIVFTCLQIYNLVTNIKVLLKIDFVSVFNDDESILNKIIFAYVYYICIIYKNKWRGKESLSLQEKAK